MGRSLLITDVDQNKETDEEYSLGQEKKNKRSRCEFKKRADGGFSIRTIMSLLRWNCRGLGETIFQKKPDVVFLCETLYKKDKVEQIKIGLGFQGCFVVEARGHSVGLAILWRKQRDGKFLSFNNHIDMKMAIEGYPEFRMTGFYGEPQRSNSRSTWNLMQKMIFPPLL